MSVDVRLRKAVASEVEALAGIAYAAWERDLLPFLHGAAASRAVERQRLSQAVHEGLDRIVVAEHDQSPVGWCSRARSRAYIPYLFVSPAWQNRGIGTMLLRRMESMLELLGAERVQLDTLSDNVRAVSFYQHQGYRILALKREARPGVDPETSVRLEKQLSPFRGSISEEE